MYHGNLLIGIGLVFLDKMWELAAILSDSWLSDVIVWEDMFKETLRVREFTSKSSLEITESSRT